MNKIIATYSSCCQMLREGDCEESIMHSGLCSKNGVKRATIKLVAAVPQPSFDAALEKAWEDDASADCREDFRAGFRAGWDARGTK